MNLNTGNLTNNQSLATNFQAPKPSGGSNDYDSVDPGSKINELRANLHDVQQKKRDLLLKLNQRAGASDKNSAAMNIEDYNFDPKQNYQQEVINSNNKRAEAMTMIAPSRDVSNLRGKIETRAEMINDNAVMSEVHRNDHPLDDDQM